jgi:hypothetical protein
MALAKTYTIVDHEVRAARMAALEDLERTAAVLYAQITVLIAQVEQLRTDVDKIMQPQGGVR